MLNLPPLPLVELYVELQSDEAEISQAYSYNNLISTLYHTIPTPPKWLTHFAAVTSADAPVNYGDFLLFTALELAISSFTAAIDESEYPVSMRRPPRHRRDRPRHSRAGRPRRVVEQDAENEGRGRAQGEGEEAHARRAQQGLVSIIQ